MLGNAITFSKANRHHSGVYTCTAENSEGNPAKGTINLEVTCKFQIITRCVNHVVLINGTLEVLFLA